MNQSEKTIMYIIRPVYYPQFTCLASDCPDTCCKGWIIEVDPDTRKRWQKAGISDSYLAVTSMRSKETHYQIQMNDHLHCPLLTSDGLCSLVLTHGDSMIPRICQDYPRQETALGTILQKTLSVRCAPVLDLLWSSSAFQYEILPECQDKNFPAYPSKNLLDGFLRAGKAPSLPPSAYLFGLFTSLYQVHKTLESEMPCDASGFRDYGQEFLTPDNTQEVLTHLCYCMDFLHAPKDLKPANETYFRPYHDMMYDVMQSFFDSPVFGSDFHRLFQQSRELLEHPDASLALRFQNILFSATEADEKWKLLIMEELFSSICTAEASDYETILLRLQWLIVQYLVIRYILFLESCQGISENDARRKYWISRIFRVTELPDILKISFFDSGFTNWLWTPEVLAAYFTGKS